MYVCIRSMYVCMYVCMYVWSLLLSGVPSHHIILSGLYRLQAGLVKMIHMNSTRTGDQPIEINFSSVTRQPVIV